MSVIFILTSILRDIKKTSQAQLLKFKYSRTMCRLRKAYGSRKIIVAFCVSEIAKWKSQSFYDKLELSDAYRPGYTTRFCRII